MDVHYQTKTYLFYQTEFQITVFERMRVVRVTGKKTIDEQGFFKVFQHSTQAELTIPK